MKIVILSCSLHEASKSRAMASELEQVWKGDDTLTSELVDLRDLDLPLCDGGPSYGHPAVVALNETLASCDACVFAVPIYNFDLNAAAKNAIEFAGRKLEGKVAGFLCAAGGHMSYMSIMAAANSLMLDFRTVVVPRFVYAAGNDFPEDGGLSGAITERIARFGGEFSALARAVCECELP